MISLFGGCSNLTPADPPDRIAAAAHAFGTTALAFTPDGQHLLSGGFRGEVRVWEVSTLRPLGELRGHRGAVRAILPLDATNFASGDDDGRLILWQDGRIRAQTDGASVTALALFQGKIVSGHADGKLRVWSADKLSPLRTLPLTGPVVALSAHGERLAAGLEDSIVLFDPAYTMRKTLPVTRSPHDLQFSPDGRLLAAGSWFRLSLWDLASGTTRSLPTEHHGLLVSVAFSPDGRHLATLGRHTDSAIRVLDTTDFHVVRRYRAHDLCGAMIRFSPDGRSLASASDDESIRVYERTDVTRYPSSGAIPSAH